MKTMGLIGGMSWKSSAEYYRITNRLVHEKLGGHHSAKSLMYSFDFAPMERLQREGDWEEATRRMINAAIYLQKGGADFVVICTNTMHRMADEVQAAIGIPLLHIADATARAVKKKGHRKVGLLGTRFTMEQDFYRGRLEEHDLQVIVPEVEERRMIDRVIYDELVRGEINAGSRHKYLEVIRKLGDRGTDGVILGCTEIGLLVKEADVDLPVFDTTLIHARAAVERAFGEAT